MLTILRRAALGLLALTALLSAAAFVRAFWVSDEINLEVTDHDLRTWRYGVLSDRGRVGVTTGYFELDPKFAFINITKPQQAPWSARIVHVERPRPGNLDLSDALW